MGERFHAGSNFRLERRRELVALDDALLQPIGRTAVLHGAPGSGKTSLARAFAERRSDRFPGGNILFGATPRLDETEHILSRLSLDSRSLLVIDEANRVPLETLGEATRRIRHERPLTTLLMTSTVPLMLDSTTIMLEMPPLTTQQIVRIFEAQSTVSASRLGDLARILEGNASAVELASRRLAAGVPIERIIEWFESGGVAPFRDPLGRPLAEEAPARAKLDIAVSEISDELIQELATRPDLLYELDPRRFEQLVAELYSRRGFEATLTPASGDEGVDIYLVSRNDLGKMLWVVQAKRNAPHRKVEAGVVRELYGTVTAKNASAGLLITTSFFQPGARDLERKFENQLSLKDYLDLQQLLRGPELDQRPDAS